MTPDGQGARRFEGVDIFATVGARSALTYGDYVTVTDGKVDIDFHHRVENPLVDAIEIIEQ